MQPVTPAGAGLGCRYLDQLFADPPALHLGRHDGVEDDGVRTPVAYDVHEPDDVLGLGRADPEEAVAA